MSLPGPATPPGRLLLGPEPSPVHERLLDAVDVLLADS